MTAEPAPFEIRNSKYKEDMILTELPLATGLKHDTEEYRTLKEVEGIRKVAASLMAEERYRDALERVVEGLKALRAHPDYDSDAFRVALVSLLFDLAEIHYTLKDYRQSEKELDILFKVLGALIKKDADKYGHLHILAMDLSTRILRSRRKSMDLLARHQIQAAALYEKVNSGVAAATEKLVESLRKVAELLAASGDYRGALKFYNEAIKYSKRRSGRITRKEVKMSLDMAEIMMRVRAMRPRARRLLEALLPHAIALGTIELEEDILALIEVIDADIAHEPMWKGFLHKLGLRSRRSKTAESQASPEIMMAKDENVLPVIEIKKAKK